MTTRVDPTFKVPVSLEPKLSYFSQYHAVVKRSIWDPLAPGISGGAIDLAGRVVVITTVLLAGYVIMAILSIPFWYSTPPLSVGPSMFDQRIARFFSQKRTQHLCDPKDLSDICLELHSHHQSTVSLNKEEILDLCDAEKLQEEECIYAGDLTVEKEKIQLLMQDSKTQTLVDYILQTAEKRNVALGALFVLLGIKPALAIEEELDETLSSILTNLTHAHLCLKKFNGSRTGYFVNETPLPSFDPRHFLNLSPEVSLTEAVALCFPEQNQRDADQFLSYLLGFGPSWEAYAIHSDYLYQERKAVSCIFNRNHYYEIGKVLNQSLFKKDEVRTEIEKLGFIFHSQLASLIGHCHWIRKDPSAMEGIASMTMLEKTGTRQMLDGLTARTDYFKKSYSLKKWVMETYFSQLI